MRVVKKRKRFLHGACPRASESVLCVVHLVYMKFTFFDCKASFTLPPCATRRSWRAQLTVALIARAAGGLDAACWYRVPG